MQQEEDSNRTEKNQNVPHGPVATPSVEPLPSTSTSSPMGSFHGLRAGNGEIKQDLQDAR